MALSCIVVDDDIFAVRQLEEYILKIPTLHLTNSYTDSKLAAENIVLLQEPVDFLFTDVEMPNLSGIDLAKLVQQQANNIILVSAYPNYAVDGYGINAKDFLPKPFDFPKFEQLINRQITRIAKQNPFIWLKSGKKTSTKIYLNNIIAIEGSGNYIKIHTTSKTLLMYQPLLAIEEKLKPYDYLKRINKSFIISTKYIERKCGRMIELKNGLIANITETFRKDF